MEESELRDWYRAADLVVLPTVAYEGFGMVTAEALATGTPVVGTPVGATPELLEPLDPRLVAAGSDPDALAAAIRNAFTFADTEFARPLPCVCGCPLRLEPRHRGMGGRPHGRRADA